MFKKKTLIQNVGVGQIRISRKFRISMYVGYVDLVSGSVDFGYMDMWFLDIQISDIYLDIILPSDIQIRKIIKNKTKYFLKY